MIEVIEVYPRVEGPTKWTNREGKEVPISRLDSSFILSLLDRLYGLAVVKKEMAVGLYESHKGRFFQQAALTLGNMDWRDFADNVFFDLEYEAACRHLNWKAKPLSADKKVDLGQRGGLERYLVGALRDCINAHGVISKDSAPSAAKRMIGAIKTFNHDQEKR
jgi:hypothetical protein